jgi:hypothetical protein
MRMIGWDGRARLGIGRSSILLLGRACRDGPPTAQPSGPLCTASTRHAHGRTETRRLPVAARTHACCRWPLAVALGAGRAAVCRVLGAGCWVLGAGRFAVCWALGAGRHTRLRQTLLACCRARARPRPRHDVRDDGRCVRMLSGAFPASPRRPGQRGQDAAAQGREAPQSRLRKSTKSQSHLPAHYGRVANCAAAFLPPAACPPASPRHWALPRNGTA